MSDTSNTPQEPTSMPENPAPEATGPANLKNKVENITAPADPSFGWTAYAERTNGRFAMVGFVALLVLESVTRQDFWTWIGF